MDLNIGIRACGGEQRLHDVRHVPAASLAHTNALYGLPRFPQCRSASWLCERTHGAKRSPTVLPIRHSACSVYLHECCGIRHSPSEPLTIVLHQASTEGVRECASADSTLTDGLSHTVACPTQLWSPWDGRCGYRTDRQPSAPTGPSEFGLLRRRLTPMPHSRAAARWVRVCCTLSPQCV